VRERRNRKGERREEEEGGGGGRRKEERLREVLGLGRIVWFVLGFVVKLEVRSEKRAAIIRVRICVVRVCL
jgi:hypothetical protein